jgi:hypothetical protein
MTVCSLQNCCPVATLAKSLLEVWLSGDRYRLRLELEHVSMTPVPSEKDDEWDRIELLRNIAWRMRDTTDLFTPRCESPRTATWLDLLNHLSVSAASVN